MSNTLLSFCIPTYNRSQSLTRLLENIVPQILSVEEELEICISNNHSDDNTADVVMSFKQKYPCLKIVYQENDENLGFDRNLLKVICMAQGEFIWTFSDDDLIVEHGINEVIEFIKEKRFHNIGGLAVKDSSYIFDIRTNKNIKYHSSVEIGRPEKYGGIGLVDILHGAVPYRFVSALIFNNRQLNKIIKEKDSIVQKGIGNYYMHSWLFFLLFLFNKESKCFVLNKSIVISFEADTKYKFYMEDHFTLIQRGKKVLFNELLSIINKSDKKIIKAVKKARGYPVLTILYTMALFKVFKVFDFKSCKKCIIISFRSFGILTAIFLSYSLLMILMFPQRIVKNLCKFILKLKFDDTEEYERSWNQIDITFTYWNKGNRRIIN